MHNYTRIYSENKEKAQKLFKKFVKNQEKLRKIKQLQEKTHRTKHKVEQRIRNIKEKTIQDTLAAIEAIKK